MKLLVIQFFLIFYCFGFAFNFGDDIQTLQLFRRDVSRGLFSIVSKNLANKNITSDAIFPDSESDLSKLSNDEIKQELGKLIETGDKLKHAEIGMGDRPRQEILEAGKPVRISATNHTHKSSGRRQYLICDNV